MVVWILLTLNGYCLELAIRRYPGGIICIVTALAGSIVVIFISECIEKIPVISRFFAWCGKNSMVILAFHCYDLRFLDWNKVYAAIPLGWGWESMAAAKVILVLLCSLAFVKVKAYVRELNTDNSE